MNNTLLVVDGLDGSGKSTQTQLLAQRIQDTGRKVKLISFPDYKEPSSALVKMYLAGELSDSPEGVNAYAASTFYAVDRYASYKKFWESDYRAGTVILASRYVTSNMMHQMSKLPPEQWDDYLRWLEDYEYNKLELPRPDLVLFLSLPLALSQKLLSKRYDGDAAKKDIHEADLAYLEQCSRAAAYAGAKLGWQFVEVSDGEHLYPIEQIRDNSRLSLKKALERFVRGLRWLMNSGGRGNIKRP